MDACFPQINFTTGAGTASTPGGAGSSGSGGSATGGSGGDAGGSNDINNQGTKGKYRLIAPAPLEVRNDNGNNEIAPNEDIANKRLPALVVKDEHGNNVDAPFVTGVMDWNDPAHRNYGRHLAEALARRYDAYDKEKYSIQHLNITTFRNDPYSHVWIMYWMEIHSNGHLAKHPNDVCKTFMHRYANNRLRNTPMLREALSGYGDWAS